METSQLRMKRALYAIFLAAFYLHNPLAQAYPVIDPYTAEGIFIQNPLFDSYFLDEMRSLGAVPVIFNESVDFYIANSTCIEREGEKCTAILCGAAICGSNSFQGTLGNETIGSALVTGNEGIHDATTTINALRYATINSGAGHLSGEYLSMIENNLVREGGSGIDATYIQSRYGSSVQTLINKEILQDPALSGIGEFLNNKDINGATGMLDKYFSEKYNISSSYDFSDIYGAVNRKQIGPAQYAEIMSTILNQYGMNGSLDKFLNASGILNSTVGQEVVKQAIQELAKNPELMKELQRSMANLDSKMLNEMMSKALAEAFKNKDLLKQYLDVMKSAMNNKEMRDMFLSAASGAIRQMQESGEIDKFLDGLKDNKVKEQILNQIKQSIKESAPTFIDKALDEIKSRVNWNYVLPAIGLIVIVAASLRSGL